MSDISIEFEWWELLAVSPVYGWPGLLAGAALGALLWRKRPIAGGVVGGVLGNLLVFVARFMLM